MNTTESTDDVPTFLVSDYVEMTVLPFAIVVGTVLNFYNFVKIKTQLRINRNKKHTYEILILNLTICDLLILLVYCLGRFFWILTYQWYGGDVLCKLYKFLSIFAFQIDSFAVVFIALNRVIAVRNRRRVKRHWHRHNKRLLCLIGVSWIVAAILCVGQLITWRTYQPYEGFTQCTTIWEIEKFEKDLDVLKISNEKAYSLYHILTVFWIPFAVIAVCYSLIGYNLVNYALRRQLFLRTLARSRIFPTQRIRTKRVLSSTAFVVMCYVFCWFPYNVLLLSQFYDPLIQRDANEYFNIFNNLIVMNAIINPLIYHFAK